MAKKYSPKMIVRAFTYFVTSRAFHSKMRTDLQLSSARTLTRITSKVSKIDENKFLDLAFGQLNDKQKPCVVFNRCYCTRIMVETYLVALRMMILQF